MSVSGADGKICWYYNGEEMNWINMNGCHICTCTFIYRNTHCLHTMTQELGNNLLQKVFHYVLPQGLLKCRIWIQLQGSS